MIENQLFGYHYRKIIKNNEEH